MLFAAWVLAASLAWIGDLKNDGWEMVGVNSSNTVAMLVKPAQQSGSYKRIWLRTEYAQPQDGYQSRLTLVEVDCSAGRSRFLQISAYKDRNIEGGVVATSSNVGEWLYIAPSTMASTVQAAACE